MELTEFDKKIASAVGPEPIKLDGGNIVAEAPTVAELEGLAELETDDELRRAIFGEDADKAKEYFRNKPLHAWGVFLSEYMDHWTNFSDLGK
ncbi:hypothetical protein AN916_08460 [Mycobacteroides immunogenum]|nr:hypothetical protein AN916_07995 [Mycobacteroides immunogenum]KPG55845.1 hypothetical protein AN916_08460 [Mycobacteroides immunogenum]